MRYDPRTDNAVYNERMMAELQHVTVTPEVLEDEPTDIDKAIGMITQNLWTVSAELRRLTGQDITIRDINSMARDVSEVLTEFDSFVRRV